MSVSALDNQVILTASKSIRIPTGSSETEIFPQDLGTYTDLTTTQYVKIFLTKGIMLRNPGESYFSGIQKKITSQQMREISAVIKFRNLLKKNVSQQASTISTVYNQHFTEDLLGVLKWHFSSVHFPFQLTSTQRILNKQSSILANIDTHDKFDITITWFMANPFTMTTFNKSLMELFSASIFLTIINIPLHGTTHPPSLLPPPSKPAPPVSGLLRKRKNIIWSIDKRFKRDKFI